MDVRYKVEEAERKFHERVLHHHIVDDEYFVLTPDNDRYNESVDKYSFYEQLNGRDRNPDAVQEEMHDLLNQLLTMKCDARWWMQELLVPQSKNRKGCNDVFLILFLGVEW